MHIELQSPRRGMVSATHRPTFRSAGGSCNARAGASFLRPAGHRTAGAEVPPVTTPAQGLSSCDASTCFSERQHVRATTPAQRHCFCDTVVHGTPLREPNAPQCPRGGFVSATRCIRLSYPSWVPRSSRIFIAMRRLLSATLATFAAVSATPEPGRSAAVAAGGSNPGHARRGGGTGFPPGCPARA